MSYVFDVRWIVIAFYVVLFGMVVWAIRSSIRDRRAKRRPYLRRNAEVVDPDPPDSDGRHLRLVR